MCLIPTVYRIISAYSQGKSPRKVDKIKVKVEEQSFTGIVKPDFADRVSDQKQWSDTLTNQSADTKSQSRGGSFYQYKFIKKNYCICLSQEDRSDITCL